jgi:DNA-formamidopyrimidine glycosylase
MGGKTITRWLFIDGTYASEPPRGVDILDAQLPAVVKEVSCKGKTLYAVLEGTSKPVYVVHSLMMSGSWGKKDTCFSKWCIELEGHGDLWFRDPRALGTVWFTGDRSELDAKLDSLGPDVLREEFTLPAFKRSIKDRARKNIAALLMDQSVLAGAGNVIKCEALYYACIDPTRKAGSLTDAEQELLFEALYVIPRKAYNSKGISIKDFEIDGAHGEYQDKLAIYGKKGAKRTATPDGRTTYWDPKRQK